MRLHDLIREEIRRRGYSPRTEEAYLAWYRQFVRYHGLRHPETMGAPELRAFLTHVAVERRMSASSQNQAHAAIVFLYRHVLRLDLERSCPPPSPWSSPVARSFGSSTLSTASPTSSAR